MKNKSYDMDFSWYTIDELLNTALSAKDVGQMDMGDKVSLIRELAARLQRAEAELMKLAR
jgi:hypothetical protein